MSLRVCILPYANPESISPATGVGKVVYALAKHLKEYDIEVVEDMAKADLFAPHMQYSHKEGTFPTAHTDVPMVLHSHGVYFSADEGVFGQHAQIANKACAASARRANVITVPSEWVGEVYRRDMRVNPVVIGHGIDLSEWSLSASNESYILWNKNRSSDVCNPQWAYELAKRGEFVIATFAPNEEAKRLNEQKYQVTGFLAPEIMKDRLAHADVYLATTKETMGIGTLEALAAGIPVLGFDWGGTKDIVRHKVDGYLAKPRDINDLMVGLQYIRAHRKELSQNARERVKEYTWDKVIGKYARLYYDVYNQPRPTGVSVIITNFNYKTYLSQAIDSVLAQTYPVDEIIVVDDGSIDDSQALLKQYRDKLKLIGVGFTIILQTNQGVASARNNGIRQATQPFIVCLDADDMLEPTYIEVCRNAMLSDRAIGITYTGLVYFNDNDKINKKAVQLTPFSFELQTKIANPPPTCIPCAAMFRRDLWERVGGYKQRYAPAEDTEFWMRMIMAGGEVKVADTKGLFLYRGHPNSASRTLKYKPINDDKPYLLDKQYPFATPSLQAPPIRSYSEPAITILLEVKGGQEYNVGDAIDSVLAQAIREWEIVILTQGVDSALLKQQLVPYPFVVYKESVDTRTALYLRLHADNQLRPDALEQFAMSVKQGLRVGASELYKFPERVDMSNCCGGNGDATIEAKRMLGLLPREPQPPPSINGRVRMRYTGDRKGAVQYIQGKDIYIAGNNDENRYVLAKPQHVKYLEDTGSFVVDQEPVYVDRAKPMTAQILVSEPQTTLFPEARRK